MWTACRNLCKYSDATVLIALLQPPPEVFDLFDDVLIIAEGDSERPVQRSAACLLLPVAWRQCVQANLQHNLPWWALLHQSTGEAGSTAWS